LVRGTLKTVDPEELVNVQPPFARGTGMPWGVPWRCRYARTSCVILKIHVVVRLLCSLKRILVVRESTTIEECGDDFNNGLALVVDMPFDLDNLALVGIGDRNDAEAHLQPCGIRWKGEPTSGDLRRFLRGR
jgi:hypothetical protein